MNEMMQWVRYSKSIGWNFNGRARRREYWWNYLYYYGIQFIVQMAILVLQFVLGIVCGIIAEASEGLASGILAITGLGFSVISLIMSVYVLYHVWPILVRRLHDRGMSGWMYLLFMLLSFCCGIGIIAWIVVMCLDGQPGDNQYGPNPKGIQASPNNTYGGGMNMNGGMNDGYGQNMNGGYGQMNGGYGQMNGGYDNNNQNGQNPM